MYSCDIEVAQNIIFSCVDLAVENTHLKRFFCKILLKEMIRYVVIERKAETDTLRLREKYEMTYSTIICFYYFYDIYYTTKMLEPRVVFITSFKSN